MPTTFTTESATKLITTVDTDPGQVSPTLAMEESDDELEQSNDTQSEAGVSAQPDSASTPSSAGEDTSDIFVSTVDAFQGGERDVILLACTRTTSVGFSDSPHRLCVALTRAKVGVMLVMLVCAVIGG
jgi:AAA domain